MKAKTWNIGKSIDPIIYPSSGLCSTTAVLFQYPIKVDMSWNMKTKPKLKYLI